MEELLAQVDAMVKRALELSRDPLVPPRRSGELMDLADLLIMWQEEWKKNSAPKHLASD